MNYQGPSITIEQEVNRAFSTKQNVVGSAWSNMRFERALILSFSKEGNFAEIITDDGDKYSNIRIQTPLEFILFMYGEVEKLKDIPSLLIYRGVPYDGFLILGELTQRKEEDGSRLINEPFYL